MKRSSAPIPPVVCFTMVSVVTILGCATLGCATAAMAQTVPGPSLPPTLDASSLARIAADLAYPNNAQRFFEAGHAQFEAEIKQLSEDDTQAEPLLTIKPEVLEQFEEN